MCHIRVLRAIRRVVHRKCFNVGNDGWACRFKMDVDSDHCQQQRKYSRGSNESFGPTSKAEGDVLGLLYLLPKPRHKRGAGIWILAGIVVRTKQIIQLL